MASGHLFRKIGNWHYDIWSGGRRERKRVGPNREVAKKILDKRLAEVTLEEHGVIEDEKITLEEFAKEYLVHKKNSTEPSTYGTLESRVSLHLVSS